MSFLNKFIVFTTAACAVLVSLVAPASAANPEEASLYMVDLWVHTCDVPNAGTDGELSVRLDTYNGQRFYLDNPGNDRERDDMDFYHVTIDGIGKLEDIQRIQFDLNGNDGWCFDQVWLVANGDAVFLRAQTPIWLDGDNPAHNSYAKIFSDELRENFFWPEESASPPICRAPTQFTRGDMKSTLDGIVGDQITREEGFPSSVQNVSWRSDSSLTRWDSNTWTYTVKFRVAVKNYWDADVDATYDIDASCSSDLKLVPKLRSKKVKFDIPWYVTVITGGLANAVNFVVDAVVEGKLKESLGNVNQAFTAPALICPSLSIDSSSNLNLTWPSVVGTKPVLCF